MSSNPSRFNRISNYFLGAAESFGRARLAKEVANMPEHHFASKGTTRDSELRRIFDL
ncbi:hypothetical protein [Ahrensia marina]|jgi:hypothetical protein|uniref:hypothetical protein n=1 Tax=Ahrensia marina TaxID=1514904 RepID=UPI000AD1D730|nr:hypothetical protein [Ahrensia marina]